MQRNDGSKSNSKNFLTPITRRDFVSLAAISTGVLSAGSLLAQPMRLEGLARTDSSATNRVKLSLRIGPACYLTDDAFDRSLPFW